MRQALAAANAVDVKLLTGQGLDGKALADELRRLRIKAIAEALQD
jgi:hypothetical protein